jgi:hypothetical protein
LASAEYRRASEIRLRAEREAGDCWRGCKRRTGVLPVATLTELFGGHPRTTETLADLGISKNQSSQWAEAWRDAAAQTKKANGQQAGKNSLPREQVLCRLRKPRICPPDLWARSDDGLPDTRLILTYLLSRSRSWPFGRWREPKNPVSIQFQLCRLGEFLLDAGRSVLQAAQLARWRFVVIC